MQNNRQPSKINETKFLSEKKTFLRTKSAPYDLVNRMPSSSGIGPKEDQARLIDSELA